MRWHGKMTLATHIIWKLSGKGVVPKGKVLRHYVCDNPPCVNVVHLRLGTKKQNTGDCVRKGRQAKGEHNGQAKLTYKQAQEICRRYVPRVITLRQLAKEFGVAVITIYRIVKNQNWVLRKS